MGLATTLKLRLINNLYRVTDRATASLPQTTDGALFSVSTGYVEVLGLWGEVTTVIQTQTNATKIVFNPTATGADVDLCATLDITGDAVGTIYTITGTFATALKSASLNCAASSVQLQSPLMLKPGDVELNCAASNTGSVKWSIMWRPITKGASIAAA